MERNFIELQLKNRVKGARGAGAEGKESAFMTDCSAGIGDPKILA